MGCFVAVGGTAVAVESGTPLVTLTSLMLPSLNMYRLWCHDHHRVHHGFTSYTPVDWIWRPLTPSAYAALPWYRRLVYRFERTAYG